MSGDPEVGHRMRMVTSDDGTTTTLTFDDKGTGRQCGSCQLCCKLLPQPELGKPHNTRCKHQKFGVGCKIYANRPFGCRVFSCGWLADPATQGMSRPDRAHYVIDPIPDFVTAVANDGSGQVTHVQVVQIWCDPAHPHAHRDPKLRAWLHMVAETRGVAAIIRYSNVSAICLFAPPFSKEGVWFESDSQMTQLGRDMSERREMIAKVRRETDVQLVE